MSRYDRMSRRVVGALPPEAQIDPVTIGIIIHMILSLIAAIQKCRNPAPTPTAIINAAKNPSKANVTLVRMATRRVLGRKKFKVDGERVVNAIIEAGANASVEDIVELLKD